MKLTAERLRELLHYDPKTGKWRWRNGRKAGNSRGDKDYVRIKIDGVRYYTHRLAWFYMTGKWPASNIDHEDRDQSNCRWSNLREATHSQNLANSKLSTKNKVGYKGVNKHRDKFRASITVNYKSIHLGLFNSALEAHKAYEKAAKHFFGKFARMK